MTSDREYGLGLLESLKSVKWAVAARTYGNSHSSLIGLIISWWNSMSETHWTMDEAPGYEQGKRKRCDVLLCAEGEVVGAVEVEGNNPPEALRKLGEYFDPKREDLNPSKFVILLVYAYSGIRWPRIKKETEVSNEASILSKKHPEKFVIILKLYKNPGEERPLIRESAYYSPEPNKVEGTLYQNGIQRSQPLVLWAR